MSEERLVINTPPLKEEAREYLRAKGCTIISNETPGNAHDQVTFPIGCSRSAEQFPRVRLALYHIYFPNGSWIVEQRSTESYLSLPIETPTTNRQTSGAWMKTEQGEQWEWDYKYVSPEQAEEQAQFLAKRYGVPVLTRQIPDEPIFECYTDALLEVPRIQHSNLCRCPLCYPQR
jgi:hypothetical protein